MIRLLHGDCRDILPTLDAESVQSIVTSPPRTASGQFVKGTHWRRPKPHWDRQWLEHELVTRVRTAAEVALQVGVTESAIDYWAAKHGIKRRTTSEVRASKHWGVSGPANPMFGKLGPASPAYVAGTTPERARLFSRTDGKAFRAAVLARDGFKCRRCQRQPEEAGVQLPVHHIKSWARYPELRYDIANGVTLCKPCHLWVHSKKNTNKEWLS